MTASSSLPSSSIVLSIVTGCAAVGLVVRTIRRRRSPVITSKLSCKCGQIQGRVTAIREDSIRITCYCDDCRRYADWVASQGGINQQDETVGKEFGDSRVVQVCKSCVVIDKGQENLLLACKSKEFVGMHRFYSSCCHVPLLNTVKGLGFVGILMDFLDDSARKFAGPVSLFPHLATKQPSVALPDIFVPDFLWKLVRYQPYARQGPFNYDLEPKYWDEKEDSK